jgi:hypothetical protein
MESHARMPNADPFCCGATPNSHLSSILHFVCQKRFKEIADRNHHKYRHHENITRLYWTVNTQAVYVDMTVTLIIRGYW